ncbi:MAG TPA: hypothetical protein VGC94_01165 [Amnibacterium sp.]|jgi:hypothetical protein
MSLRTPRPHTVHTVCEHGVMCVDDRAGHAVTLLRARLAHLAPQGWTDARVLGARADGVLELERWSDGEVLRVWNHADLTAALPAGSLVALHGAYGVLAAGDHRYNVAAV